MGAIFLFSFLQNTQRKTADTVFAVCGNAIEDRAGAQFTRKAASLF